MSRSLRVGDHFNPAQYLQTNRGKFHAIEQGVDGRIFSGLFKVGMILLGLLPILSASLTALALTRSVTQALGVGAVVTLIEGLFYLMVSFKNN